MRRVNEFFRQDVKIRSNRSKEEYPPPAIYHVSREIMVGRGLVGGGIHVSYRVFQEIFNSLKELLRFCNPSITTGLQRYEGEG